MSSSDSSQSIPFKSKKLLKSTSKAHAPCQLTYKTPEKPPAELQRRTRNRGVALSVKEVRKMAQTLAPGRTDQIESARRQISSWPDQTSVKKPNPDSDKEVKLPEKYEMLGEFFHSLDSAIRLLRLKGSMTTFTNVCPKIECLTDRRFSFGHLAKLKFILPEAIEIKKILVFDERTSCMKPDLHITLHVDSIEYDGTMNSESKNLHLRKVFRSRLEEFFKNHPKVDEVPEETLPEPFSPSKQNMYSNVIEGPISTFAGGTLSGAVIDQLPPVSTTELQNDEIPEETANRPVNSSKGDLAFNLISPVTLETSTEALRKRQPAVASHLSQSFRRSFSQKATKDEAERTGDISSEVSFQPSPQSADLCHSKIHYNKEASSYLLTSSENCTTSCISSACLQSTYPLATPSKRVDPMNTDDNSQVESISLHSTPAKLASTPARLMTATPALLPPKRCYMSPEEDSTSSPNKLTKRPPRSRAQLKFDTPVKNEKKEDKFTELEDISVDNDILDILPENLLQSIREKERKFKEESDPAISRAKRRRQMISCLPKLFNMIYFLFQSMKRSVMTKEELIQKIIASHCDIVDRREVEEQLTLLLELVPEWISEKLASAGDLLVCINKTSSPGFIRTRLEEAN